MSAPSAPSVHTVHTLGPVGLEAHDLAGIGCPVERAGNEPHDDVPLEAGEDHGQDQRQGTVGHGDPAEPAGRDQRSARRFVERVDFVVVERHVSNMAPDVQPGKGRTTLLRWERRKRSSVGFVVSSMARSYAVTASSRCAARASRSARAAWNGW